MRARATDSRTASGASSSGTATRWRNRSCHQSPSTSRAPEETTSGGGHPASRVRRPPDWSPPRVAQDRFRGRPCERLRETHCRHRHDCLLRCEVRSSVTSMIPMPSQRPCLSNQWSVASATSRQPESIVSAWPRSANTSSSLSEGSDLVLLEGRFRDGFGHRAVLTSGDEQQWASVGLRVDLRWRVGRKVRRRCFEQRPPRARGSDSLIAEELDSTLPWSRPPPQSKPPPSRAGGLAQYPILTSLLSSYRSFRGWNCFSSRHHRTVLPVAWFLKVGQAMECRQWCMAGREPP